MTNKEHESAPTDIAEAMLAHRAPVAPSANRRSASSLPEDAGAGSQEMEVSATESMLERRWNQVRHYGFRVGSFNLLLPSAIYSELLVEPIITPLPNSPTHFCGLVNLRGNLVPVYSIAELVGGAREVPGRHRQFRQQAHVQALLIGNPSSGAALLADDRPVAVDIRDCVPEVPDQNILPSALLGVVTTCYQIEGKYWYLIDHLELFYHLANTVPTEHIG